MEFGFLTIIASGLLNWGHLIFNTIIDLTTPMMFNEQIQQIKVCFID